MLVTQQMTYNSFINDIMRRQKSILDTSRQLATGRKVNVPSDDPISADGIFSTRSVISDVEQYERNIDSGLSYLNIAENVLTGAEDVIINIHELAISQGTDTANADTRKNTAIVIQELYDELLSVANTKLDRKYIFSGYLTDTAAFDSTGAYQGDANRYRVKIGAAAYETIGITGDTVFAGSGVDIFQTVSDLVTALNSNDSAGIRSSLANLDSALRQVSDTVSEIGGRVIRLEASKESFADLKLDLTQTLSSFEDADITKVISRFQLEQTALEAALQASSRFLETNIFDYI